ncbi:EF-hand domain-containing protein [Actinokineospora terrae]|uniref:Ca2+-binding protein, EF-hand superfamily n=1 Tax=Actinokineospora terrae TaxID=155974 RepID=A0A1H9MDF6_9PSEU|nr:EF-hand domain-containing protein [Actinokineospora terrae]SER21726.1 Ca2+-binding protein, EF-hand superfamily [Actinokineospora terrae]
MRSEAVERVELIFRLFDANGSGQLDSGDFDLMARRVVAAASESAEADKERMAGAFRKYWETLEAELDADRDGLVSLEEFSACTLSPERFDATVAEFAEALGALGDPDGDGLIERPVFAELMSAIGFRTENIHALFDAFGPSEADRIRVATWVEGIKDYYQPEKAGIAGDQLVSPSA